MYIIDQGATLHKSGERLIVQKMGGVIQWVHAFKVEQIVLMGNIQISSPTIAFLLEKGIDTVFLSSRGKYRGRLISKFGKNIILRQLQFRQLDKPDFCINLAKKYVKGKLHNYRILLRRHNYELQNSEITKSIHLIRQMAEKTDTVDNMDVVRGFEGKGSNAYFSAFKYLLKEPEMPFSTRNRRPPRDPVNALLSFGYTLLANTVQTVVNIVGLDPYLGSLHSIDYGRPSLVLDLMEEFRPVIVDAVVIKLINKRIITPQDFYIQQDVELPENVEIENLEKEYYPVLLTHQGTKKLITQYEKRLNEKIDYEPTGQNLSYRTVCLEQARLLVRHLKGEQEYVSYQQR